MVSNGGIDWDATLQGVELSSFGNWLPYDFATGEVNEPGVLSKKVGDVVRSFAGPTILWKPVTRATLVGCQAEISNFLYRHRVRGSRRYSVPVSGVDGSFMDSAPAQVFRTFSRLVTRTEAEWVTSITALMQTEVRLRCERNRHAEDRYRYRGERDRALKRVGELEGRDSAATLGQNAGMGVPSPDVVRDMNELRTSNSNLLRRNVSFAKNLEELRRRSPVSERTVADLQKKIGDMSKTAGARELKLAQVETELVTAKAAVVGLPTRVEVEVDRTTVEELGLRL